MKVDILRQLDEWGSHIESTIDHVTAAEVIERADARAEDVHEEPRRTGLWQPTHRRVLRWAGALLIVVVALGGAVSLLGGPVSDEFNSVGNVLGGANNLSRTNNPFSGETPVLPPVAGGAATTLAPATTAAPTTFASSATAAPTTVAATTTLPPDSQRPAQTTIPPAGGNPTDLGRAVIFVADMAIDTTDVSGAVTQARAIVESRGGFVSGQELGGANTVMSLKVPAQFFQDTLDRLSELGVVRNARITSEDVTERIVDLESQIATATTSVARLRELLAEAGTIETITRIESQLLERETNLERLRGQLRTLQDQVALSTIVVTIREFVPTPDVRIGVAVHAVERGGPEECFTDPGPRPEKDATYVACVVISNTGNMDLANIEVGGPPDLTATLRPTDGGRLDVLPVGETVVLWTTSVATEDRFERFSVRATALDEEGRLVSESIVERERPLDLVLPEPQPEPEPEPEPEGIPSLRRALQAGWNVLTTAANLLGVALAFLLPLIWIPIVALGVFWLRRRRSRP